ncbi:MAG: nucleoside monophosphate kinase, partial [Thermomicrobiales bacterium]|nr:nucleoside monophosphate kinase [Thermomicrobiales bacterium]
EILASGNLVEDELTLAIVDERLNTLASDGISSYIFDGFPRTTAQAVGLDQLLETRGQKVDAVIELTVPEDVLIERMSSRRVCSGCGANYNLAFQTTQRDDICDQCGGQLVQRPDDMPGAIRKRLQLYNDLTKPLLDFYGARGLVTTVDGNQDVERVQEAIVHVLSAAAINSEA